MRVAIAGGTGMLGRHVAEELRARGHEVRVLSRHAEQYPVDLTTGSGLDAALAGCDAVVDASNDTNVKRARALLVDGTRRLTRAGLAAGVRHHVAVSIVGCEKIQVGYYKVKCDQEREVRDGGVPWTIVRATQFHGFLARAFATSARAGVLPLVRTPMQTVAATDVALAVADVVASDPRLGSIDVVGPEVLDARELARLWKRATHSRALPVRVPVPGNLGRALRAGALTADLGRADVRGEVTFAQWLRSDLAED